MSELSRCTTHHQTCHRPPEPPWAPTRLIEIRETPHGHKLRITTGRPHEPYVALSHCWGTAQEFKLLSHNLADMQLNIDISRLPKTFQDAITITTWIGGR
jgi:hypothetical protein